MRLYIKYMVSQRCIMAVKEALKLLELHFVIVEMGIVDIMEDITISQSEKLKMALFASGLELMEDKKAVLLEKIKNAIIEIVHFSDELPKVNFSDYLSEKLKYDYTYLANIFTEIQGITIEKYLIALKIEMVKELIMYDQLNLTEIAWKMRYSSVAHLSNQFKKITGLTPSHFKKLKDEQHIPIENI